MLKTRYRSLLFSTFLYPDKEKNCLTNYINFNFKSFLYLKKNDYEILYMNYFLHKLYCCTAFHIWLQLHCSPDNICVFLFYTYMHIIERI